MSEWTKKIKDEAKGLFAEAEQELTALEGVDTVDLTADETAGSDDASSDAADLAVPDSPVADPAVADSDVADSDSPGDETNPRRGDRSGS